MKIADIERYLELLDQLRKREVYSRLPSPLGREPTALTNAERRFVMLISSRLALGVDADGDAERERFRRYSYEAVTKLVVDGGGIGERLAADAVLARLGHFPARPLLKNGSKEVEEQRAFSTLAIEVLVREQENTVIPISTAIDDDNAVTEVLTDFQYRLFDALGRRRPVSVSAPTSAGKSFVLSLDIIRELSTRVLAGRPTSIVYLVPTRALIRQAQADVLAQARRYGFDKVTVTAAPTPVDLNRLREGVVYVLTQERLMSLLNPTEPEPRPRVDVLYVDEAQELEDDDRGMILHTAVSRVREIFPKAVVHFASPLAENPGFLLSEFSMDRDGEFFTTEESPVSQTLIMLGEVDRKPQQINVRVLGTRGVLDIGVTNVNRQFRGVREKLATAALAFTAEGESSIIYANDAGEAEQAAKTIADNLPEANRIDDEVQDLIDFLHQHIHRRYLLIDLLRRGVAYHYGAMPHVVRARIEDLVRTGKIRFVCSTSTLLQGVNLPAKNIFVQQPMRGRSKPMTPGDFWNLAGRAGRLRYTFNGNVWCIERGNWVEEAIRAPRLRRIRSAFREALNDDVKFQQILDVVNDPALPSEQERTKIGEQAFAKVVTDFALTGISLAESHFATDETRERLRDLDVRCRNVVEKIVTQARVPGEVLKRNSTISPWKILDLWQLFSRTGDIRTMLPPDPRAPNATRQIQNLFQRLDEVFFRTGNESYRYFGALACHWCRGDSLRELIANRIDFYKVPENKTNATIRDLLEALERQLHYKYVKYLRTYNETLAAFLGATNRSALASSLVPLHSYIEFGASDLTTLLLIAAGLSRTTALLLMEATYWPRSLERDEVVRRLRALDVNSVSLPEICRQEIRTLFPRLP